MHIFKTIKEMKEFVKKALFEKKTIGFVPTMGYLHPGHLSLVHQAKKENDIIVMSIYVNPTQFVQGEDFERYPRDFLRDEALALGSGVEVIFYPSDKEIYPHGLNVIDYHTPLFDKLCGKTRPGHFQGVVTIVKRLFEIIYPTKAYFGQKDFQQTVIIKQMIHDLKFPVEIVVHTIVREKDGLAMSSRNVYLNKEERESALSLYTSLLKAKQLITGGERNPHLIKKEMRTNILKEKNTTIDYIEIVNAKTLESVNTVSSGDVIMLAVFVGKTRLIDNCVIN
ncbi:pantoate--beta-alanine ligase [Candidatus Woesearchaeota archaeon]|nr:pantoate--beta-alanine ligase [Candidatus Woesearchaeota archaeon]